MKNRVYEWAFLFDHLDFNTDMEIDYIPCSCTIIYHDLGCEL